MRKIAIVLLLAAAIFLTGCTSAGPYVTNIGYDGNGDLMITTDTVEFNWFFGVDQNGGDTKVHRLITPKNKIDTSK